jgi:hypothetical protein
VLLWWGSAVLDLFNNHKLTARIKNHLAIELNKIRWVLEFIVVTICSCMIGLIDSNWLSWPQENTLGDQITSAMPFWSGCWIVQRKPKTRQNLLKWRAWVSQMNYISHYDHSRSWSRSPCSVYYPEPFLRAVRRGALAKSISELVSDWLVLKPDIVFLPCFYCIRLWIWSEPLFAPRVRRALGTRMVKQGIFKPIRCGTRYQFSLQLELRYTDRRGDQRRNFE